MSNRNQINTFNFVKWTVIIIEFIVSASFFCFVCYSQYEFQQTFHNIVGEIEKLTDSIKLLIYYLVFIFDNTKIQGERSIYKITFSHLKNNIMISIKVLETYII